MGDRGTWDRQKTIYSQQFNFTDKNNRKGSAEVVYTALFSVHAYESGDIHPWGRDDRACHFDPIYRKLIRDIKVSLPDGTTSNIAGMEIAAPMPRSEFHGDPCGDHIPGDLNRYINDALADVNQWQPYINADLPNARAAIELFGTVT